jgi:hypothetical protein
MQIRRVAGILALWAIFNLGMSLMLRARGEITSLSETRAFLTMSGSDDSWRALWIARSVVSEGAERFYQRVNERIKFNYP